MKSLKHYIAESIKTYKYRLKIVGDVDQKLLQLIEINLQKFSPAHIGDPKTTPIQKTLPDFPDQENNRITTIDVEFRYPVIEPFVKQMAQLLGLDPNRVRMVTTDFDDSINREADKFANQADHSPVLNHTELEDSGKEAAKAYSESYLSSIKEQMKGSEIDIPYAAKETPDSFDPFAKPNSEKIGINSPMSKMTRQAKPATGASK